MRSLQVRKKYFIVQSQLTRFGNSFMKQTLFQNLSQERLLQNHRQKTKISSFNAFSSKSSLIVPFLLKDQVLSFLILIVHLITAAVIQMVDLSTLFVIVPLSNTEHVATNQKQALMKGIIHILNLLINQIIKIIFMKVLFMNVEIPKRLV